MHFPLVSTYFFGLDIHITIIYSYNSAVKVKIQLMVHAPLFCQVVANHMERSEFGAVLMTPWYSRVDLHLGTRQHLPGRAMEN